MHTVPAQSSDLAFPTAGAQDRARNFRRRSFPELTRKLAAWREATLIRQALDLAGQPNSILDIPCGTGRLWPVLLEKSNRMLIGADDCADMLAVAQAEFPTVGTGKLRYVQTVPETINLHDSAVDCIFCIRLFSRVDNATHRQQLLREFHRVTRDTLILSLWVDGNLQAWRHRATMQNRSPEESIPHRRLAVARQQIEAEFAAAGFDRLGHFDLFPLCHMTRTYILRKR